MKAEKRGKFSHFFGKLHAVMFENKGAPKGRAFTGKSALLYTLLPLLQSY